MDSSHTAVIIPFDRSLRVADDAPANLSVTEAAVAAAVRMQEGANQLLEQAEADREMVVRVQSAMGELMEQVNVLETTTQRLLTALRVKIQEA
jgi:hypothetical protein